MSKNTIVSLDKRLHALFGEYASLTSQTPKTVKTTVKEVLKFQSYVLYSPLPPANC